MAIRPTLFDDLPIRKDKNLYCELKNLDNEASVETFFVNRLLVDLGYKDCHIKTKKSLDKLKVSRGSKSCYYKPDYCIVVNRKPRFLIDAKGPKEDVYEHVEQCAHYALILNRRDESKPVKYFMLSNGLKTVVYKWDSEEPLVELSFSDFENGNERYERMRSILSLKSVTEEKASEEGEKYVTIKQIDKEDAQKLFSNCHRYIWKAEKRSPSSAFMEFIKIIFVKLWQDRLLHNEYGKPGMSELRAPAVAVTFSVD